MKVTFNGVEQEWKEVCQYDGMAVVLLNEQDNTILLWYIDEEDRDTYLYIFDEEWVFACRNDLNFDVDKLISGGNGFEFYCRKSNQDTYYNFCKVDKELSDSIKDVPSLG